jgi:hypothetical protein
MKMERVDSISMNRIPVEAMHSGEEGMSVLMMPIRNST